MDQYCIYTDRMWSALEINSEHVLPLCLGGINGFEIPVSSVVNARLGSEIDGKVAAELAILARRVKTGMKGHSGKPPVIRDKRAELEDGTRVSMSIDRHQGIRLRAPQEGRFLSASEIGGRKFTFRSRMDLHLPVRFIAKTALAAGYYCYGELFRKHVNHEEPRWLMNHYGEMGHEELLASFKCTGDDYMFGHDSKEIRVFKRVCRAVADSSCVGVIPMGQSLVVFVGLLGQYYGMIELDAETSIFPNSAGFEWGRFICPRQGRLVEASWARLVGGRRLSEIGDVR